MPILVDFILAIYAALCFKQLSFSLIMAKIAPNFRGDMNPKSFFLSPVNIAQKQYEALRSFYTGECSASEAAKKHGYSLQSFYSLNREVRRNN